MSTSVQWDTRYETSTGGGWMLGQPAARRVSKPRNRKIAYGKTLSHSPSHRGWMLRNSSPQSTRKENESALIGRASEAVFLDYQKLSVHAIDRLAEKGLDWISLLPSISELEILNVSLLGVEASNAVWLQTKTSIDSLAQLTQSAKHYPLHFADSVCWSYTCCLQIAGLGRVRLVIGRQGDGIGVASPPEISLPKEDRISEKYVVFITNRLDWSPRKVISQSLQLTTLTTLMHRPTTHRLRELVAGASCV